MHNFPGGKMTHSKIGLAYCLCFFAAGFFLPAAHAQSAAQKTYQAKCVACHAADGSGSDVGKKLGVHDFHSPETQKMSDADLADAISKGKNKMPSYAKALKPEEITDLVAYIRQLSKKG
jgi:cytochrome c6